MHCPLVNCTSLYFNELPYLSNYGEFTIPPNILCTSILFFAIDQCTSLNSTVLPYTPMYFPFSSMYFPILYSKFLRCNVLPFNSMYFPILHSTSLYFNARPYISVQYPYSSALTYISKHFPISWSSDFLLNPFCIMLIYTINVLLE